MEGGITGQADRRVNRYSKGIEVIACRDRMRVVGYVGYCRRVSSDYGFYPGYKTGRPMRGVRPMSRMGRRAVSGVARSATRMRRPARGIRSRRSIRPRRGIRPRRSILPRRGIRPARPARPRSIRNSCRGSPCGDIARRRGAFCNRSGGCRCKRKCNRRGRGCARRNPGCNRRGRKCCRRGGFGKVPRGPIG